MCRAPLASSEAWGGLSKLAHASLAMTLVAAARSMLRLARRDDRCSARFSGPREEVGCCAVRNIFFTVSAKVHDAPLEPLDRIHTRAVTHTHTHAQLNHRAPEEPALREPRCISAFPVPPAPGETKECRSDEFGTRSREGLREAVSFYSSAQKGKAPSILSQRGLTVRPSWLPCNHGYEGGT